MTDGDIDYSGYTREQVLDALQNVDAEAYPKNAANLAKRLDEFPPAPPEEPPKPADPPSVLGDGSFLDRLGFVGRDVQKLPAFRQPKPTAGDALDAFGATVVPTLTLLFREPEVFILLLLQWAVIVLGYFLWLQALHWIPESVWRAASETRAGSVAANIVLLVWSFACVGLVSFPLGLLSACVAAVEILRRTGNRASLASCVRLVAPRIWEIWVFTWADAWITVNQILDRLPSKNGPSWAARMAKEAAYYAWKVGSASVLPSLVVGHGLIRAGKDSVHLLTHKFREVVTLRLGYSYVCWLIGISAYFGTILMFLSFPNLIPHDEPIERHIGEFYFWAGMPIAVATGIVVTVFRPMFLFGLCSAYVDYHEATRVPITLPQLPSRLTGAVVAFLALAAVIGAAFVFRRELGIVDWIARK